MAMLTPPQAGRRIPVEDGRTVLDAVLAAGILCGRAVDDRCASRVRSDMPAMVEAATAALLGSGPAAVDVHADVFFTPETNDATLNGEVPS